MKKVVTLLVLGGLLSACQTSHDEAAGNRQSSLNGPDSGRAELDFCARELGALRQLSLSSWQIRNTELAGILTQEKMYRNVRNNISEGSVTIMDAAYVYKISRVCNDIRNDLTRELVDKVENAYQPRSGKLLTPAG